MPILLVGLAIIRKLSSRILQREEATNFNGANGIVPDRSFYLLEKSSTPKMHILYDAVELPHVFLFYT
jgi:hypothetical protein